MLIRNGEAFIKIKTATAAIFSLDTDSLIKNEHLEYCDAWLTMYTEINAICNIRNVNLSLDYPDSNLHPLKINGMCEVEISYLTNSLNNEKLLTLKYSKFIDDFSHELLNYNVKPINFDITPQNYIDLSYLHVADILKHTKDISYKITPKFLNSIIIDDKEFMITMADKKPKLDTLINKYFKYFKGIPESIILEAFSLAETEYFLFHTHEYLQEEASEQSYRKLIQLFNEFPPTKENIEKLRKSLPKNWSEAIICSIKNTEQVNTIDLESDDTPNLLYFAYDVYKEVWDGFNPKTTTSPPKASIAEIIKKKGIDTIADIEAIIRLSTPDGIKLGGKRSRDKKEWLPFLERQKNNKKQ